jgi:hypothetical protein
MVRGQAEDGESGGERLIMVAAPGQTASILPERPARPLMGEFGVTQTEIGPTQNAGRPRRFTLGDGLLVVAAIAAGFAMVRRWANPHWCAEPPFWGAPANLSAARQAHYNLAVGVSWPIPFVIAFTPAILAARLRSPRPALERIAEQPGSVACAAALLAMVLKPTEDVLYYVLDYFTHSHSPIRLPSPPFARLFGSSRCSPGEIIHNLVLERFPLSTAPAVATAVLIAWLVLLGIGRFRPERDWVDRAGRVLGVYWMALVVFTGVMAPLRSYLS